MGENGREESSSYPLPDLLYAKTTEDAQYFIEHPSHLTDLFKVLHTAPHLIPRNPRGRCVIAIHFTDENTGLSETRRLLGPQVHMWRSPNSN